MTAAPVDDIDDYHSLWVSAERYNTTSSSWEEVWTFESEDAVSNAQASTPSDSSAFVGVSGLLSGQQYRFRAAWCRLDGQRKGCNCWSNYGYLDEDSDLAPDPQPTAFPSVPIDPPIPTEIEDRFRRHKTTPKRDRGSDALQTGDGLGLTEVWNDDQGGTMSGLPGQNGSYIAESNGTSYAAIPENALLRHSQLLADPHSYSEVIFQPDCSTASPNPPNNTNCTAAAVNYRVDVRTRTRVENQVAHSFVAQALYEPDWSCNTGETCCPTGQTCNEVAVPDPTVRIIRAAGGVITHLLKDSQNNNGQKVEGAPAYSLGTEEGCTIDGAEKSPDSSDIAGLKDGSDVLFRIEAEDEATVDGVDLEVLLAWDCDSSGCTKQCIWKVQDLDTLQGHPLHNTQNHMTGFMVHHWDAMVHAIRAGSTP